jgi:hypothetical protein
MPEQDPQFERIPVTDEQFALFEKTVREWWTRLGLDAAGIRLTIARGDFESQGQCHADSVGRTATIYQATRLMRMDANDTSIKCTALHEVCHAFLIPFCCLAGTRYVSEAEVESAEHDVVRRLEHVFSKMAP